MSIPRVVVVDDEVPLAELVRAYLEDAGMDVLVEHDGQRGLRAIRDRDPDVVVLDVMLPGLDGFEVLRQARAFSDAYVIMLTARAEEVDRVVGLSMGADDYLVKPFSPRELAARVRALLRRRRPALPEREGPLRSGRVTVDARRHSVTVGDAPIALTTIEFDLLRALIRDPGAVFTRQQLLDAVWGIDYVGDERVVDVHVAHLRRKLGDQRGGPRSIETVRGVGFRFHEDGHP